MARPLGIDYPGGPYHITSRGVGKQDIFFDDEACLRVLDRKGFHARDIAIYLSRELTKETHTEMGSHFGGIRPSAVSLACKRVADRIRENAAFRCHVDELTVD